MLKRTTPQLLLTLLALWLLPLGAYSTTILELSFNELTKQSTDIVHGHVISQKQTKSDDGQYIFTTSKVLVDTALKGEKTTVSVSQLGGTIGDTSVRAFGVVLLQPEQEVVLFLEQQPSSLHKITGMQGLYLVHNGIAYPAKAPQTEYVTKDALGKLTESPGLKKALPLKQLFDQVKAAN